MLALARTGAALAYRRRARSPGEAVEWARLFVAGAALNGVGWGAATLLFHAPASPAHEIFIAFVFGGMAAGAASSNAGYGPAFAAFAVPSLLPLVVRFAAERDAVHAAMACMVAFFGLAVAGISRAGGRAVEAAIRLRFRNEALVEDLTAAQGRLEVLNADLEQRVAERTAELAQAGLLASVGSLAAGVAHEINNPLAYILANLEHLSRTIKASAELRPATRAELLEVIRESLDGSRRVRQIVRDLGSLSPRPYQTSEAVDVRSVLEPCINVAMGEVRARATLIRELADVPPVIGDATRLAQVFLNLLVNAAQAIPVGAPAAHRITVRTRFDEENGAVEVEVEDTGAGISLAHRDHIFEPFFTTKPIGLGTGLGLSICHGIVTALGGRIRVRSAEGKGSTFTVCLRASNRREAHDSERPTPVRSARP